MAGILEDFNKTPAELELELSKAKGRVARLEALLGNRADVVESRVEAAELGASFVDTMARHEAKLDTTPPEDYWRNKVGTSIPQPDGYSGCGLEKPSWAKPELKPINYLPESWAKPVVEEYPFSEKNISANKYAAAMMPALIAEARNKRIQAWSRKLNSSERMVDGLSTIFSDLDDRVTALESQLKNKG
jgi:hypothetical protein